jgi:PTS system ascorbate-specific IIA component
MSNGIFIIAHAPLASALRQCVLHVFPDATAAIAVFDVMPNMPSDETVVAARMTMKMLNKSNVLVITDVFGATPCNVAQKLVDGINSRLVAGVNLPMLLRAITYRHESLDALVARTLAGGTQGVMQVAVSAPQNQALKPHDKNNHDHQQ